MNRRDWRALSTVFSFMLAAFLGTLCAIGFFGPSVGAPEEQRTLALGPFWISRIHEQIDGQRHRWWTEVNWTFLWSAVAFAGFAGYVRTRFQKEPTA